MIKKCTSDFLREISIFEKLPEKNLMEISRIAIEKEYAKGEFVAFEGDVWPYTLILLRGAINVQKLSAEGRSLGAWSLSSGEVFWSLSLFDDAPLPASLEARQDSVAYLWKRNDLLPIIQDHPQAIWDLCTVLVRRIRRASNMVEDLAFQPVATRLARLLVKQYEDVSNTHISRSLTLDDMATMIGTTPVMVCKIISQFASKNLLKVSRTEFQLIDRSRLEEIADLY